MNTINKVLDNAFKIVRKGTKHRNEFSYNTFERPITHITFFQLLHNSDINLKSFDLINYMCHIKATDYVYNWRSDIKLVVSSRSAMIEVKGASHLNIYLNFEKFTKMFGWFNEPELFATDFGALKKSEKYYHENE